MPMATLPLPNTANAGVDVPVSPIHKGYVEVPISMESCGISAAMVEGVVVPPIPKNP